ncbi:MAG TPA: hypothetical protein VG889_06630 [Rhizomicrobium sp.]|nr:hypothetical protein [Rhizomicrobium sp.]
MKAIPIAALLLQQIAAQALASPRAPEIGDVYEIVRTQETVRQGSNGSSASSHDKDTIVERVIGLRADGLELEFDLPQAAQADERAGNWQFPVRVFKPFHGQAQLLDEPALEARVDGWLKAAGLTREACGHWIFTWNAFRIECDPQSAIKAVEAFDMDAADLREGASYPVAEALAPGRLARKAGPGGAIFTAEMPVDPDAVRRARAESDVVVGEIAKKPVTFDAALQARAKETVSGTISVTLEADAARSVYRRTKVTKLEVDEPDGGSQNETVTETLDRRLVSSQR